MKTITKDGGQKEDAELLDKTADVREPVKSSAELTERKRVESADERATADEDDRPVSPPKADAASPLIPDMYAIQQMKALQQTNPALKALMDAKGETVIHDNPVHDIDNDIVFDCSFNVAIDEATKWSFPTWCTTTSYLRSQQYRGSGSDVEKVSTVNGCSLGQQ